MATKIIVTPKALQDLQKAIDYYNDQQKGLGKRFENTVNDTFFKIAKMPQAASFAYDTVRYKVMDKFPFIVTYEETQNTIVLLRVFNQHQDAQKISDAK